MVTKVDKSAFDLLGKRWSALIIKDLIGGPRRFRELLSHVGRINDKVLSQRLKELEERGIVDRSVYAEVPVRVEYTLTNRGQSLASVIREMEQWDAHWGDGSPQGQQAVGSSEQAEERPVATEGSVMAASATAQGVAAAGELETPAADSPRQPEPRPAPESLPQRHQPPTKDQRGFWRRLGL